uniref:Cytochrome b n=1 Tax=Strongyloides sp. EN-2020c TaxID=2725241 RepID=A0A6J4CWJ1_9BILA|nr:cytochrome b [Strongyloides sp. EN-2020c]BCD52150.1 cytochrome b [Strongyloides sp. EN-2020c]
MFRISLFFLPTSRSLTFFWNFGSILGMIMFLQIMTGLFLSFYYVASGFDSFLSVQYIMLDVNYGWFFRLLHFNGASFFFFFLYLHFFKGLYMCSYRLKGVWLVGLVLFFFFMMEAFMGYVLVWAQMSFWASVVITSLLSVIPYFGSSIVYWIWGGFSVVSSTLKFFFVIHFLLPWLLFILVFLHLFFLHSTGSTSSIYCHGDYDKICFYPYYVLKDFYNFIVFGVFFIFFLFFPFLLGDPEMFIESDPMLSPVHIVPEWYFLFAYAILRAIPNKVLGVVFLVLSIFVFFFFVFFNNYYSILDNLNFFLVSSFIIISVFLSWLGQCHVEYPFEFLSIVFSFLYFFVVFLIFCSRFLVFFLFS